MLTLVAAGGMAIGSAKFKGIGLGSAGVLFMGILVAHFSQPIDTSTLDFVKEFGLVLFVFTIGLQLGPGFFASLKAEGLKLNLLAATLVLLAGVLTPLLGWLVGLDPLTFAGLFAGASTNSPALGAAQQTLASMPGTTTEQLAIPALACAVSYPIAIAGLLSTLVFLKAMFRIDPVREAEEYAAAHRALGDPVARRAMIVDNHNLDGLTIGELYHLLAEGVVISRVRAADQGEIAVAHRETRLHVGDALLVVGTKAGLDHCQQVVGHCSEENLLLAASNIAYRKVVVTHKRALGRTVGELSLESRFGVEVTRTTRGDWEMTAVPGLRLKFGDVLQVVGNSDQIDHAAAYLGNSLKKLNETQFIPLFAGILLGVVVGSIPIALPGLSAPLRMGLAGGPLVVALALGRIGHFGGLVWHIPHSANHAFREFGVALFFAALGLAAGDQFFAAVLSPRGMLWAATGLSVTVVPLLVVGIWARAVGRMNFTTLSGMLSGAMTNPPALSFANNLAHSEAPALAYATVYPLTTLLRIIVANVMAAVFWS
jgi:putative transport protein